MQWFALQCKHATVIFPLLQVYGPESSGKTTLALHAMAEVQKSGGTAALIDAEHAFDPEYSKVSLPQFSSSPESRVQLSIVTELLTGGAGRSANFVPSVATAFSTPSAMLCDHGSGPARHLLMLLSLLMPWLYNTPLCVLRKTALDVDNMILCRPDNGEMANYWPV